MKGIFLFLSILLSFASGAAHAHADGENYVWLTMEQDSLAGKVELNQKDIAKKLSIELDLEDEGEATQQQIESIQQYLQQSLQFSDGGERLEIKFNDTQYFEEKVEMVQFFFESEKDPANSTLEIRNSIFLDKASLKSDLLHKSIVLLEYNKKIDKYFGQENIVLIFDSRNSVQELDFENPSFAYTWPAFFKQGILHILLGFDHVLFVITILLTCAMTYARSTGWVENRSIKSAAWTVFKLLTVFTIAHSITLTLSALGLLQVNIAVVELVIVLSILVMALNNIKPLFSHQSILVIFVFGLFHGVGFASVMNQLAFRNVFIERIVLMFNLGIEFGQLLIAIVIAPLVYFLSRTEMYRKWGMVIASLFIALIAAYWFTQRIGAVL